MALKKDKQKVLGEHFDDERIRTFLEFEGLGDEDNNDATAALDFHLLEKAYRGMKADNFTTFLDFFIEAGHDINATNPQGDTFLSVIRQHRPAADYIQAMQSKGAQ